MQPRLGNIDYITVILSIITILVPTLAIPKSLKSALALYHNNNNITYKRTGRLLPRPKGETINKIFIN